MTRKSREIQSSGASSLVGQSRRALYAHCIKRINEALETEFFLEAITLLESLICDRLEARLAHVHGQCIQKRTFSTLGKLTAELKGPNSLDPDDAKAIYEEIAEWSRKRNEALHELAKLEEECSKTWEDKYQESEKTAKDGLKLFRKLDTCVRKLNR